MRLMNRNNEVQYSPMEGASFLINNAYCCLHSHCHQQSIDWVRRVLKRAGNEVKLEEDSRI